MIQKERFSAVIVKAIKKNCAVIWNDDKKEQRNSAVIVKAIKKTKK